MRKVLIRRLLINYRKKARERTEPCETPQLVGKEEIDPLTTTGITLSVRKPEMSSQREGWMPEEGSLANSA